MAIRIVLAEDHDLVRQAVRDLLGRQGFEVAGEARDGGEAVALCEQLAPDVAVLDDTMAVLNGEMAALQIRRAVPRTQIVLLTARQDREFVMRALRAGARGYALKMRPAEELIAAIREVHAGNVYLAPPVSGVLVDSLVSGSGGDRDVLSVREREILKLVAEGCRTREISERLHISQKTVESHRCRIQEKLNLRDTASLVRYAVRQHLIEA